MAQQKSENIDPSKQIIIIRNNQTVIWKGMFEWIEKTKTSQMKQTWQLPCSVISTVINGEPEVTADYWPTKLTMQLFPKVLLGSIGQGHLKNSKSLIFIPSHCEPLIKAMSDNFAGCVHFEASRCKIKVLVLLYTVEKKTFLGLVPSDQQAFVDRLRDVIQKQKNSCNSMLQPGMNLNSMKISGSGPESLVVTGTNGMQVIPQQTPHQSPVNTAISVPRGTERKTDSACGNGAIELQQVAMARQQGLLREQELQKTCSASQQETQTKTVESVGNVEQNHEEDEVQELIPQQMDVSIKVENPEPEEHPQHPEEEDQQSEELLNRENKEEDCKKEIIDIENILKKASRTNHFSVLQLREIKFQLEREESLQESLELLEEHISHENHELKNILKKLNKQKEEESVENKLKKIIRTYHFSTLQLKEIKTKLEKNESVQESLELLEEHILDENNELKNILKKKINEENPGPSKRKNEKGSDSSSKQNKKPKNW